MLLLCLVSAGERFSVFQLIALLFWFSLISIITDKLTVCYLLRAKQTDTVSLLVNRSWWGVIIGFIRWPKTQFIGVNMSVMCRFELRVCSSKCYEDSVLFFSCRTERKVKEIQSPGYMLAMHISANRRCTEPLHFFMLQLLHKITWWGSGEGHVLAYKVCF